MLVAILKTEHYTVNKWYQNLNDGRFQYLIVPEDGVGNATKTVTVPHAWLAKEIVKGCEEQSGFGFDERKGASLTLAHYLDWKHPEYVPAYLEIWRKEEDERREKELAEYMELKGEWNNEKL